MASYDRMAAPAESPLKVCLSVDVEQDCPPYLNTFRGLGEGLAAVLDVLDDFGINGTFFTTGQMARGFPRAVESIVEAGHELGCHGMTHRSFRSMDYREAVEEIEASAGVLRTFAPVVSFRAPYLNFPAEFLPILTDAGFLVDSSQGSYKWGFWRKDRAENLLRVPVSATSSLLRLPGFIRQPWLGLLRSPVVLFVHPWEFVDLRREKLRLDCRFRTGDEAARCLRRVIGFFQDRRAVFPRIRELLE